MLVLAKCTEKDIALFARRLFNENRSQISSFEKAAQLIVDAINNEFRQEDGNPLFALLRIFRFSKYDELPSNLKALATASSKYWLVLMASIGTQPAWCDHHASQGHRVIPADSPVTPMLKAAFEQIGLRFGGEAKDTLKTYQQEPTTGARYFYIPTALGSPYVPAQDDFVVPHKIQSVIGIGSLLEKDSSYMCIGFSQSPIEQKGAAAFAEMNPFIGTLLATQGAKIWE